MRTSPLLHATAALLCALPAIAQEDLRQQLPVRGGERLLRQVYLALTPADDAIAGSLQVTIGAGSMAREELRDTLRKGVRWHVGHDVWPVLHTSNPLQFEVEGGAAEPADRYRLAAGRYVVSVQNGDARRHLVFTRADVVENTRIHPSDAHRLVGLGGTYVPLQLIEHDDSMETPSVRLTSDEPDGATGTLSLRAGSCSFEASFEMLRAPQPKGRHADRRLDALLTRVGVDKAVRHALLDTPGRVEVLALAPDSFEDDERGEPKRGEDRFHGYRVLGRRSLDMADDTQRGTIEELQAMLRESILAHPDRTVYDCFEPRHGLRIRGAGDTIDLVLCFACEQANAFQNGEALPGFLVARTWEPRLSDCFRKLGLTIAR